ncbi:MAG: hypothetical protein GC151_00345 [Betaproteobacteria bacterium]|nr:hypothetical protein [Betaproteobacteria bacterium]
MTPEDPEVTELADVLPAGATRAALRYAEGDADAARTALEQSLSAASGERREWLMLLDLERIQGRWQAYESLVARYRMRFGEDAPTERERNARESAFPEELRAGGSGCVSLGGDLNAGAMHAMAAMREAAVRHTVIHLDVSRVERADGVGCRLLHSALSDLVEAGNGIVLTGGDHLCRLIRRVLDAHPAQLAGWDLLLFVRRLMQDRTGFERDAVDFALATSTQTPGWEPLLMPQPVDASLAERRREPRYVARELLALDGIIEAPEDLRLVAAAEFAGAHEYVNLDLAALERLSLPAATVLAQTVSAAAEAGRTVRLIRPNQLVAALLELLNLGQCAAIVTPKA